MDEKNKRFDGGTVFSIGACLFLGGCLFLFFYNNALLAHGGRNLWNPAALVMLGVLGIPFVLVLLHLVRRLPPSRNTHT